MRDSVKWFAEQMESKLQENDHKGGWDDCDTVWLFGKLQDEVSELFYALRELRDHNGKAEQVVRECADVANFAMMIADLADSYLTHR